MGRRGSAGIWHMLSCRTVRPPNARQPVVRGRHVDPARSVRVSAPRQRRSIDRARRPRDRRTIPPTGASPRPRGGRGARTGRRAGRRRRRLRPTRSVPAACSTGRSPRWIGSWPVQCPIDRRPGRSSSTTPDESDAPDEGGPDATGTPDEVATPTPGATAMPSPSASGPLVTPVPVPSATARPTPARVAVDVDIVRHPEAVFAHEIKDTWCAAGRCPDDARRPRPRQHVRTRSSASCRAGSTSGRATRTATTATGARRRWPWRSTRTARRATRCAPTTPARARFATRPRPSRRPARRSSCWPGAARTRG